MKNCYRQYLRVAIVNASKGGKENAVGKQPRKGPQLASDLCSLGLKGDF